METTADTCRNVSVWMSLKCPEVEIFKGVGQGGSVYRDLEVDQTLSYRHSREILPRSCCLTSRATSASS